MLDLRELEVSEGYMLTHTDMQVEVVGVSTEFWPEEWQSMCVHSGHRHTQAVIDAIDNRGLQLAATEAAGNGGNEDDTSLKVKGDNPNTHTFRSHPSSPFTYTERFGLDDPHTDTDTEGMGGGKPKVTKNNGGAVDADLLESGCNSAMLYSYTPPPPFASHLHSHIPPFTLPLHVRTMLDEYARLYHKVNQPRSIEFRETVGSVDVEIEMEGVMKVFTCSPVCAATVQCFGDEDGGIRPGKWLSLLFMLL